MVGPQDHFFAVKNQSAIKSGLVDKNRAFKNVAFYVRFSAALIWL